MRLHTVHAIHATDPLLTFVGEHGERLNLSVIDQHVIRVRLYPEGAPRLDRTWMVGDGGAFPREGLPRDAVPSLTPGDQNFTVSRDTSTVTINTSVLRVVVHLDDLRLEWFSADGKRFAADLRQRAYTYDRAGRAVYHYMERRPDEAYYGFGEVAGGLDKRGASVTLKCVDALGYNAETSDPLYKHFPFYVTHIPDLNISYGLLYDNLALTRFDMGKEIDAFWGHYRAYAAQDGDIDYYLIYGDSLTPVVEGMGRLTGRPALPPRWSLGYLGSTMYYTEAPDAQEQLKRFADLCDQHDIPCDMFHLSSGYTTDAEGRRNIFTWNRARIPQPEAMVRHFHDAGIKLAPNIKPYLLTTHPDYEEVKRLGGFIRNPETGDPALARFWSGGAFTSGEGAYIDFTSEAGYNWWKRKIKEQLLAYGIDAVWNDNNEFELWDDDAVCAGFGKPFRLGLGRPLQTLLMARASYEAIQEYRPDETPFVLTRSACPGVQRYAQSWSGDNDTSWHTLQWNLPMGLNLSLSGFPNTGHDVGGFFGSAPEPELLVRWVQCGIFFPRFAIHSWNTDGTVNEPWMYPDVLPVIRETIRLRYRLIPYLYAQFERAHARSTPIMRPLVYQFPTDARGAQENFDFMLGADLLVAPVYEQGIRTRSVYLPDGETWLDFYNGESFEGGQTITADAPLEHIPLFVRRGGQISRHNAAGSEPLDRNGLWYFNP